MSATACTCVISWATTQTGHATEVVVLDPTCPAYGLHVTRWLTEP